MPHRDHKRVIVQVTQVLSRSVSGSAKHLCLLLLRLLCLQEEATTTAQQDQPSTSGRNKLTTEEWRAKYEKDGAVDLFLVDQFNAAMVVSAPTALQQLLGPCARPRLMLARP